MGVLSGTFSVFFLLNFNLVSNYNSYGVIVISENFLVFLFNMFVDSVSKSAISFLTTLTLLQKELSFIDYRNRLESAGIDWFILWIWLSFLISLNFEFEE